MAQEPFCFVAEKEGRCFGVCTGEQEYLDDFYHDFVGFQIRPIASSEEYQEYIAATPFGSREEEA